MSGLNRILDVYVWAGVSVLLIVLYRIARFYQITSNEPSHYRWFAVPLVLFVLAALRYVWVGDFAGDLVGDGLTMLAGGSLLVIGYFLLTLMTGGRR